MLKVKAGHYRDVFRRRVYDVFRDKEVVRFISGTRTDKGWRYQINGEQASELYEQKERAAYFARVAIHDALDCHSEQEV